MLSLKFTKQASLCTPIILGIGTLHKLAKAITKTFRTIGHKNFFLQFVIQGREGEYGGVYTHARIDTLCV